MLIAWNNLGDAGTVTSTSTDTGSDPVNTQHPQMTKVWRSAAGGSTGAALIWDLGSAQSCGVMFLGGVNLTASATVRIRSSDTDATVTSSLEVDTGTVTAGVVTGYGQAYKTFTPTSSRYWRVDIVDSGLGSTKINVGRVFLGPYWTPTYGHSYNWSVGWLDPSEPVRTRGGQTFVDARTQARVLQFSLDYNNEAQMFDNAFALAKANGRATDVLVMPDTSGSYVVHKAVWGLLSESQPIVHANVGIFRQKFTLMERL